MQDAREVLSSEIPQTVNCTFLVADTSKPNIEPEVDRVVVHFGFGGSHTTTGGQGLQTGAGLT